jgi:integrase
MALKVPRLAKSRNGVFFVRVLWRDATGKRHIKQISLQTKQPALARVLALKFNFEIEATHPMGSKKIPDLLGLNPLKITTATGEVVDFDPSNPAEAAYADKIINQAREQAQTQVQMSQAQLNELQSQHLEKMRTSEAAFRQLEAQQDPYRYASHSITATAVISLKDALEQHFGEEDRRGHAAKTMLEKKAVFADFLGFFGDIPLSDITRERIGMKDGWRDTEYKRPNEKHPDKKRSGNTLEKRRGYLSKFFEWARDAGKYPRDNPMTQKMATKAEMSLQRTPWAEFTNGDIKALFCASYAKEMDKPDFYWLPLMALFSGARLGELARLELSTFEEVDGVKCYRIQDGKTLESRRTVPIHSQLLALGLWDYAQALKDKGEIFLIPHRPQDPPRTPKNKRTRDPEKMTGRQWGLWVQQCGITDPKKVFHSFRSTAITDLHNTEAKVAAIQRSVGHTTHEMAGVHGNSYVRGIALKNLQTAMEHLSHSQVDFQALKLQDPTFTAFFAHEEAKKNSPEAIERVQKLARYEKAKAEREERNRDKRKTATKKQNQ